MVFAFYIIIVLLASTDTFGANRDDTEKNAPKKTEAIILSDGTVLTTPSANKVEDFAPEIFNQYQKTNNDHYDIPTNKGELDNLLAYSDNYLPNNMDVDIVNKTSLQFEEIKAKEENKTKEMMKKMNILKQGPTDVKRLRNAMDRATALMTQFVYGARYKLQYSQNLREVYRDNFEYRIGYSFALIRDMSEQQLHLYSTMHFNFQQRKNKKDKDPADAADFDSYLQMYEKIVRLDIDIMDVIALVKNLEMYSVLADIAKKEAKKKDKNEKKQQGSG